MLTGRARVRTCSLSWLGLRRHFEVIRQLPVHRATDPAATCPRIMLLPKHFFADPSPWIPSSDPCIDQLEDRERSGDFCGFGFTQSTIERAKEREA